jgi:hypothetical protein
MSAVRASALVGTPCTLGLDPPGMGPHPASAASATPAALCARTNAIRLRMIALQCSPRLRLGLANLELVYCSGCCSELFVDYAYLCRQRPENPRRNLQLHVSTEAR